jgi:hypothetical protein
MISFLLPAKPKRSPQRRYIYHSTGNDRTTRRHYRTRNNESEPRGSVDTTGHEREEEERKRGQEGTRGEEGKRWVFCEEAEGHRGARAAPPCRGL